MKAHWLAISRRKRKKLTFTSLEGSCETRKDAVDLLIDAFNLKLQPLVRRRLEISLVTRVPYHGIVEVIMCECQDGKHSEEVEVS
jgi:hypothetical protein